MNITELKRYSNFAESCVLTPEIHSDIETYFVR